MKFNAKIVIVADAKNAPKPGVPEFVSVVAQAASGVKGAQRRNVIVMLEKNSCPWKVGDRCKVEETFGEKKALRLLERP